MGVFMKKRNHCVLHNIHKIRGLILCLLSVCICLILLPAVPLHAEGTGINITKKVLLTGETYVLKTNLGKKIKWKSSRPGVARVSRNGKITARKAGKAVITATSGKKNVSCTITVKDTVDVIVFAGQSNMTGNGNAALAPDLRDGAGYAYNPVTGKKTLEPLKEPFGRGQDDSYFQNADYANGSMVTAFVNSYYSQTKTPVIAVPAASVGTGSVSWAEGRYRGVISRTNAAVKLAKKQGLTVRHVFLVWMQGENDAFARMSGEEHRQNLTTFYKRVSRKTDVEACLLITIPSYYKGSIQYFPSLNRQVEKDFDIGKQYKVIQNAQKKLCKENKDFYLISTKASSLNASYLRRDGIHLTQEALNMVGRDAGTNAGKIAMQMP